MVSSPLIFGQFFINLVKKSRREFHNEFTTEKEGKFPLLRQGTF